MSAPVSSSRTTLKTPAKTESKFTVHDAKLFQVSKYMHNKITLQAKPLDRLKAEDKAKLPDEDLSVVPDRIDKATQVRMLGFKKKA